MRKIMVKLTSGFLVVVTAGALLSASGAESRPPADGSGAFATGKYRNLFAEIGKSPAEIRQKLTARSSSCFTAIPRTKRFITKRAAIPTGRSPIVTDIKHNDVRSEGLSYGMIIAVQLDKKAEFDAIWNWSKTYLYVARKRIIRRTVSSPGRRGPTACA
jgi:oligosaccharide reducing-end xylanase